MKNEEMNTARMQTIAKSRGMAVWAFPSRTALAIEGAWLHLGVDVFDLHRRLIHQNADGQRQSAQGHQVDRLPGEPERDHGRHQRQAGCSTRRSIALRQSRRNSKIIRPTSTAPNAPSLTTPQMARVT